MVAKPALVQRDRPASVASDPRDKQVALHANMEDHVSQRGEYCESGSSEESTIFKVNVLTSGEQKELQALMQSRLETSGTAYSKFVERTQPPVFSGNPDEFDAWRQRFIVYIELRSVALARGLQNVHDIPS